MVGLDLNFRMEKNKTITQIKMENLKSHQIEFSCMTKNYYYYVHH